MAEPPSSPREVATLTEAFTVNSRKHGKGAILFAWNPVGGYVASTGTSRVVHVFDRWGSVIDQVVPPSASVCSGLEWSADGNILAIVQENSRTIVLWNLHTHKVEHIDVAKKDLTFIRWSKQGHTLAVGSTRGKLALFTLDEKTGEPTPVEAAVNHRKRMVRGLWSEDNTFAYISDDSQITVCKEDGAVVDCVRLKSRPTDVVWGNLTTSGAAKDAVTTGGATNATKISGAVSAVKTGGAAASTATRTSKGRVADTVSSKIICAEVSHKSIVIYNAFRRTDDAVEFVFEESYGAIVAYHWLGNGAIVVGFLRGYVVVISTSRDHIGRERFCGKFFDREMTGMKYCPDSNQLAMCGDNQVKVYNMQGWREHASSQVHKTLGKVVELGWSYRGEILSVATANGYLFHYDLNSKQSANQGLEHDSLRFLLRPVDLGSVALALVLTVLVVSLMVVSSWDMRWVDFALVVMGQSVII